MNNLLVDTMTWVNFNKKRRKYVIWFNLYQVEEQAKSKSKMKRQRLWRKAKEWLAENSSGYRAMISLGRVHWYTRDTGSDTFLKLISWYMKAHCFIMFKNMAVLVIVSSLRDNIRLQQLEGREVYVGSWVLEDSTHGCWFQGREGMMEGLDGGKLLLSLGPKSRERKGRS